MFRLLLKRYVKLRLTALKIKRDINNNQILMLLTTL